VWLAFTLGGYSLLFGASELAVFPSSHYFLKWVRLLSGLVLMLAGVLQLWAGVMHRRQRRQRRTQLLQAVATVVSALERRRREESSPDQD
jgi:hypothetical protein